MDPEQTVVLSQVNGHTPVPGVASWSNSLGGEGLFLPKGSQVSLSDAIIDVSGDDTAQSFIFTEDMVETISFYYWVWDTSISVNGKNWHGGNNPAPYTGQVMKVQQRSPGGDTTITQTYTLTIPAGKYTATSLADYVTRTTRAPVITSFAMRGLGNHDASPFTNEFYKEATYTSEFNTYVLTSIDDETTKVALATGKAQFGSANGLNLTYDEVSQKFKWGFLHTPLFVAQQGQTPQIGIGYETVTLQPGEVIQQLVAADTGIAVTAWTTKGSWEDTLWHRLGFTQTQLTISEGYRTQAAATCALTAGIVKMDGYTAPTPLTAAYDESTVPQDVSYAQGPSINALSPAWNIRVKEIPITWRRDQDREGSLGRVTRSYAAAGFVFGQGSRTYTLEADITVQSLTVEILDSTGSVTRELGPNNSISLDIALAVAQ